MQEHEYYDDIIALEIESKGCNLNEKHKQAFSVGAMVGAYAYPCVGEYLSSLSSGERVAYMLGLRLGNRVALDIGL
jgi:hypothetical protein